MRLIAATLLGCSAFAVAVPWIDRPGTALLGLAAWTLARPRRTRPALATALPPLPAFPRAGDERDAHTGGSFAERLQQYVGGEATR